MSSKTLNSVQSGSVQSIAASGHDPKALTYSIEPRLTSVPAQTSCASTNDLESVAELESFLEGENPLGCFRGVMWVMAFNSAVLLLGFVIWQSWKFLR